MNDVHGINEDKLKLLTEEIQELANSAAQKLTEIQLLVNDSSTYFKGDAYQAYKEKFNQLSTTFPNVKNNIISYAEELTKVIELYNEDQDLAKLTIEDIQLSMDNDI